MRSASFLVLAALLPAFAFADAPALRRIESDRIDAMDGTPEFKRRLKDLKGVLDVRTPAMEPVE
jgi:hypothetical protein